MATAALNINDATSDKVAIIPENAEYRVYTTLNDDGTVQKRKLTSGDFNKFEAANPKAQLELMQPVRKYQVGSWDGAVELIGDVEETLNILNSGIALKINQKLRAKLLEETVTGELAFEPTASVYDTRELLQEETKRKNLSPTEKLTKELKKLGSQIADIDPQQILALLMSLQASAAETE